MAQTKKKPGRKPTFVANIAQLAERLDVSDRTIARWLKRGMPGKEPRGYHVRRCHQWAMANDGRRTREPGLVPHEDRGTKPKGKKGKTAEREGTQNTPPAGSNGNAEPTEPKGPTPQERFRLAKAELAEMELQRERGELLSKKEVIEGDIARITELRKSLMSMAQQLATRTVHMTSERDICATLQEAFSSLCRTFARNATINTEGQQ